MSPAGAAFCPTCALYGATWGWLELQREHEQGHPRKPDPEPVRAASIPIYQGLASFRRVLAQHPDVPAEIMREMLENTLEACENLVQALDRLHALVERWTASAAR